MFVFPAVASACPGCKEALFDPGQLPQRLALAKGYALSIGLMLAVPVGLIGGIAALIVRAQRRRARSIPPPAAARRAGAFGADPPSVNAAGGGIR